MLTTPASDLEPSLAKKIALGDADPVTLLPMRDINPNFVPRALKRVPPVSSELIQTVKGKSKDKEKDTHAKNGILSFFGLSLLYLDKEATRLICTSRTQSKDTSSNRPTGIFPHTFEEVSGWKSEWKEDTRRSYGPRLGGYAETEV
jgi:hypothetical protein